MIGVHQVALLVPIPPGSDINPGSTPAPLARLFPGMPPAGE